VVCCFGLFCRSGLDILFLDITAAGYMVYGKL
jgi:hypothetical protein